MKYDLEFLALNIIPIVTQAGDLICQLYNEDIEVLKKEDGSPVTQADHKSHLILKKGLEQLTPSVPVISEEDEGSWTIKSDAYWLIDPLDGTKGFIHKSDDFCINIALMVKDIPILGMIHIPVTQETFYAYDKKAWRSSHGKTIQIQTRPHPPEGLTLLLGGYGKKSQEQQNFFLKSYPIAKIKHFRSAIKFCYVASGLADLYLRFEPCSEWDTAAGQILVEAAGGIMTKLDGKPFIYGKTGLINEGFVAFGKKP